MTNPHEKDLRILDQVAAVCRPQDASALRRIAARLMELEDPSHEPIGYVVRDKDGKLIRNHREQIVLSNEKGSAYKSDYDAGAVDVPIYLAQSAAAVPDGWKLATIKPDKRMSDVGASFLNAWLEEFCQASPDAVSVSMFRAMLAASPQPPASDGISSILLRVEPGEGDGIEVYAKSVDDVRGLITELSEKLESAEIEIDRLRSKAPASEDKCSTNAPFANCAFRICDLPGQCKREGKCHHPRKLQLADVEGAVVSPASEDKRDAERYRWLRIFPNNVNHSVYSPALGLLLRDEYLDAAIDAARGAK